MKKILSLLALSCLSMGAWAQTVVTTPQVSTNAIRYSYTLNCYSTAHAGYIADTSSGKTNNGQINGQKSVDDATRFVFESAGETNKYYIKSIKSGKYINAASTSENAAVTLGSTATTVWTIAEYSSTGSVGIFPDGSTNTSLNNHGGTNNMRIGPLTSTGNACSMWYLNQYEENLTLADGTTEVRPAFVSTTSTKTGTETPNLLVDADGTETKWGEDFTNGSKTLSIVVRADNSILKGYTLYNGNDTNEWPGRSWKTWKVEGANSADAAEWTELDNRVGVTMDCSSAKKDNLYVVANTDDQEFSYYKITLTRIDGLGSNATMHQMSDLKLHVKYNVLPVEVTYTYHADGYDDFTVTKVQLEGSAFAAPETPVFGSNITLSASETVSSTNNECVVNYTSTLPFTPGYVYRLKVRNTGDGKYVSYANNKPVTNSANGSAMALENLWTIERVAGTVNDFKLYNLGVKQYLNGNGFSAAGKAYTIGQFPNTNNKFNFVVSGTTNNCIGDHSGENTQLGEWSDGSNKEDAGSCFWVESITEEINSLTEIAGDDESVKLGAKTFTVNAAAKSAAAENPTKENCFALFVPHFVDVVDANKLYRLTFKRPWNNNGIINGTITATGYAETDGAIRDYVTGSTTNEATRQVDMQPKNESNISQLWKFVAYGENGQYTLVSPNANGYRLGTPNGTSATSTTHITATEQYGVKLTPSAQATDGYWVLKVNDTNNYLNASNQGTNITSYGNAFSDGGNPILIEEVNTIPLTIKTSKWASVCFPVAVTLPSELTAYAAVKVSTDGVGLDALADNVVPANTPVIITTSETLNEAKTYNLTIGGTASAPEPNLFTGTTIVRQGFTHDNEYNYGLSNGSFVRMTGTTVAANKAYIHAEEDLAPAAASPLRVYVVDNTVTGINAVATPAEQGAYYDLNGRMVAYPTTGVYVRNGKKIFVK